MLIFNFNPSAISKGAAPGLHIDLAMELGFRLGRTILVFLLILSPVFSFAEDRRVDIKVERIRSDERETYDLVQIDIDPERWDHQSDSEAFYRRHFADYLLRQVNEFLRDVHIANGKKENGSSLDRMILDSFRNYPDPYARLEWSDAGRNAHKVDDYFERRSLIIFLQKTGDVGPDSILATAKYVVNTKDRELAPLASEYRNFLPAPMAFQRPNANNRRRDIEYENLAQGRRSVRAALPLIFETAMKSEFFSFLSDSGIESETYLNAEDSVVPYHEKFGFIVDPAFYKGLPAKRMHMKTREYLKSLTSYNVYQYEKSRAAVITPEKRSPLDWRYYSRLLADAAKQKEHSDPALDCQHLVTPQLALP